MTPRCETFNQGVLGSSPSALTNKIKYLDRSEALKNSLKNVQVAARSQTYFLI